MPCDGTRRTPPLESEPTVEFHPVFAAFRRMASDLNASRTALEEAQRRTAAVLRNVASGVVAVDTQGRVLLANPRAETLLDTSLAPGAPFDGAAEGSEPVSEVVQGFLTSEREDEDFAVTLGSTRLRARSVVTGRLRTSALALPPSMSRHLCATSSPSSGWAKRRDRRGPRKEPTRRLWRWRAPTSSKKSY